MARIEYDPLAEGTTAAADLNTIFSAISTEAASLDADNFEEEGLDYRLFEDDLSAVQAFTPITCTGGPGTQTLSTSWATVNPSHGSAFQTGAITVATNERLRVVFCLEFVSNASDYGIPVTGDIQFKWVQTVSATPSDVGTTRRVHVTSGSMPASAILGANPRVRFQVVIDGSVSLDSIEVQIKDASGNNVTVQIGGGSMHGTIFRRVTV
jgi:hypothetical protein